MCVRCVKSWVKILRLPWRQYLIGDGSRRRRGHDVDILSNRGVAFADFASTPRISSVRAAEAF